MASWHGNRSDCVLHLLRVVPYATRSSRATMCVACVSFQGAGACCPVLSLCVDVGIPVDHHGSMAAPCMLVSVCPCQVACIAVDLDPPVVVLGLALVGGDMQIVSVWCVMGMCSDDHMVALGFSANTCVQLIRTVVDSCNEVINP